MGSHRLLRWFSFGLRAGVRAGLAILLIFPSTACLHRHRRPRPTTHRAPSASRRAPRTRPGASSAPPAIVQGEEGIASWYGHPYHGRRAANGEIYDMYAMTAAHRTLPFGTQVRVHDLDNGSEVGVRINDRGPFVEGRIIDLSYAAAQAVRMVGPGTARVRLEILNSDAVYGSAAEPGIYAVQVGAFRERANAERLQQKIAAQLGPVIIQSFDRGDGLFHRVRVGHERTEDAARDLAHNLRRANLVAETFVVRLN